MVDYKYIKIENGLFDALVRIRISGEARQVFDFIIRKTYGFNKKHDELSLSQFVSGTGLSKPTILRSIKKLLSMNLIDKKVNGKRHIYSICRHYDKWKPLTKKITLTKKIIVIDKKVNSSLTKKITPIIQKTTTTKDNITKDSETPLLPESFKVNDKKKKTGSMFIKPSLKEAEEYIKEKGYSIDAEAFIDHYTSNGWKVGKNPMKDWQATIRTWERRNNKPKNERKGIDDLLGGKDG